jgi:hypothetical protein
MCCESFREDLEARVEGMLDPAREPEVGRHVSRCETCRRYESELRRESELLVAALSRPEGRKFRIRWAGLAAAASMALAVWGFADATGSRIALEQARADRSELSRSIGVLRGRVRELESSRRGADVNLFELPVVVTVTGPRPRGMRGD